MTMLFLSVGLSSCVSKAINDFCLVAEPLQPRDEQTARFLFENDRDLVKKLVAYNEYGKENCGWEF